MTTQQPDRLLTNDALAAIAARAEAYEKASEAYTEACATTLWLSTPKTRDAEYDARIALDRADAEFIAHARADIPPLLAHIRAQDAELARLREERAPSCQNGCLLMVKCHDVEEYYEDKDDATNT